MDPMCAAIQRVAPQACDIRLAALPVVGRVLLGCEAAGLDSAHGRRRLIQSAIGLLHEQAPGATVNFAKESPQEIGEGY